VSPDPKPLDFVPAPDGQRAMAATDPRGPKLTDFLEAQRGMRWISKPEFEILSGQTADLSRQDPEPLTKAPGRRGPDQAAPPVTPDSRTVSARRPSAAFRFGRLPRSAGPIRRRGARASVAPIERIAAAAIVLSPARSLEASSHLQFSSTGAAVSSSLSQWGRARRQFHPPIT